MTRSLPQSRRRISVTKLQRDTVAAVELFQLCDTITADGHLSDDEIVQLRKWSDDHAATPLPARDHIRGTLDRILIDGIVSESERGGLYLALEAALPPDLRAPLQGRRKAVEDAERAKEKAERDQAALLSQEERARNRVLRAWNFMVAGVRYEGRPAIIRDFAELDADVYLHRQPGNPFSKNAVAIQLKNGMQLGFVPERDAVEMAPFLDGGHPYVAFITKVLTGGHSPIPVVQADIFRTDSTHVDLTQPGSEPPLQGGTGSRAKGCLSSVVFLAGGVVAWFAFT